MGLIIYTKTKLYTGKSKGGALWLSPFFGIAAPLVHWESIVVLVVRASKILALRILAQIQLMCWIFQNFQKRMNTWFSSELEKVKAAWKRSVSYLGYTIIGSHPHGHRKVASLDICLFMEHHKQLSILALHCTQLRITIIFVLITQFVFYLQRSKVWKPAARCK